jgi:hypothetical protein
MNTYVCRCFFAAKKIEHNLPVVIDLRVDFPDYFTPFNEGAYLVDEKAEKWPTPVDLPTITDNHMLMVLIKTRDPTPEQLAMFGPDSTSIWFTKKKFANPTALTMLTNARWLWYFIIYFGKVISIRTQKKLLKFWDYLVSLGLIFPDPKPQCSTTLAVHLGLYNG